jgi:hypothetical protein
MWKVGSNPKPVTRYAESVGCGVLTGSPTRLDRVPRVFCFYLNPWLYTPSTLSTHSHISPMTGNKPFSTRTPTPSSSSSSHTLPWSFQVSTPRNQIQFMESTPLGRLNRLPTRFLDFILVSSLQRYSNLVVTRSINSMSSFEYPLVEHILAIPRWHP